MAAEKRGSAFEARGAAERKGGPAESHGGAAGQRKAREPKKPAAKLDLMQVALAKLNQRDRTKQQLRQLLVRKTTAARRTPEVEAEKQDPAPTQAQIDEVLARLEASGLMSDERFAEHFARGARNRGASAAKVRQKLAQHGIAREGITQALATVSSEGLDDLAAAQSYVKRRRLTLRYDLSDPKERQKALASLARQGFSSGVAIRALGADGRGDPDDF